MKFELRMKDLYLIIIFMSIRLHFIIFELLLYLNFFFTFFYSETKRQIIIFLTTFFLSLLPSLVLSRFHLGRKGHKRNNVYSDNGMEKEQCLF